MAAMKRMKKATAESILEMGRVALEAESVVDAGVEVDIRQGLEPEAEVAAVAAEVVLVAEPAGRPEIGARSGAAELRELGLEGRGGGSRAEQDIGEVRVVRPVRGVARSCPRQGGHHVEPEMRVRRRVFDDSRHPEIAVSIPEGQDASEGVTVAEILLGDGPGEDDRAGIGEGRRGIPVEERIGEHLEERGVGEQDALLEERLVGGGNQPLPRPRAHPGDGLDLREVLDDSLGQRGRGPGAAEDACRPRVMSA